jgi:acetyl/propionyl-CoA carboxylase alpha subunit/acetyl-CoA carboxylase carboxyltransferase component
VSSERRELRRLAIANRGEAAMRCIRAVKALRAREGVDLQAIALYTAVDRDAPFVRHADAAFEISSARGDVAAFLDHDVLLAALQRAGADAVWPGWGFVAEDADFAERVEKAGIAFLGPSARAMRLLGDKISAKRIATQVGVPVTPWSEGPVESEQEAARAAERLGYPLLIKASAGGGGRGIRKVAGPEELGAALRSARAEAEAAFGDAQVFLERKVSGGRHIEVQVLADQHGFITALGSRDCSVQRRHQKLLEEAPPPHLEPERRARLEEEAVRVARHVGYASAGTVEFLVTDDEHHFLEMNPRLQVEHGITEVITGLDLVELQIRVARGERLAGLAVREHGVAIEARVCAEDPDAGFLPSPGRIARFDPALGPRVRVDSGVSTGSQVPASFDSLVAKVIASGEDREEALARLACALADFELVIEGGASNKGFLLEVLEAPEYRRGGVDTEWLDRFAARRSGQGELAAEALVAAGILAYQAARRSARLNFYSDATAPLPSRVPPSRGQQIDLRVGSEQYRLEVYAVGSWRYRVHEGGRVAEAELREEGGAAAARLELGGRSLRVLYDADETGLRIEVEGRPYRFGLQTVGQVRAGTPAMVVTIHVEPGQAVRAGEILGVLEAMKMEIGFEAPVSGVVKEVRARRGQQVAAGEVLLVIDPAPEAAEDAPREARLRLPEQPDPLAPLFSAGAEGSLGAPDLAAADRLPAALRRAALEAARSEVQRVLLCYDAHPERAELLACFLDTPLPPGLSEPFLRELAEVSRELELFADVEQLFIRAPRASVSGELGPSNSARLRMYVRRLRAGGAGIAEEFLSLVRAALSHYGVDSLDGGDALERAVLRLLATQHASPLRGRLVSALLRRVTGLAERGGPLRADAGLEDALARIASMRGLVSNAVADGAVDARYTIFERARIERLAERTNQEFERWLASAQSEPSEPPEEILRHLAEAPRGVFERVGRWLGDAHPSRRAIAVAAHLRRIYARETPLRSRSTSAAAGGRFERIEFEDGRVVLGAAARPDAIDRDGKWLEEVLGGARGGAGWPAAGAVELFVPVDDFAQLRALSPRIDSALLARLANPRLTLSFVTPGGPDVHRTFVPAKGQLGEDRRYHGIHPETVRRIDLDRLANFELDRLPGSEGIYGFQGRSRSIPSDERIFVLVDVRGRSPDGGREATLHLPAFEHAFYEATRSLRAILAERDPKRRLHWNRITLTVEQEMFLDPQTTRLLARRLAPATRNLGLEKVVVRIRLLDREHPERAAEPVEIIISDLTGSSMQIHTRQPHTKRLEPVSEYERKVVEARRRRLVYPYEIIRMLTGSGQGPQEGELRQGASLPLGSFEEYDLDLASQAARARCVAERPYGENSSAVVFGIISTPTEKVPEGMRRVLVLSDPTLGMGSLAAPECQRLVAAIDLAEQHGIPVEWIPVSSGARIALESGTENLDATARVVRRIVRFTQAGGVIHLIVHGVNVGAQSYFDALSTMLMHTRGALIMTPRASMVLTGRAALEASGAVSAEDEEAIGGFERIMGPNGEAQYFATDLSDAYRILFEHYRYTYVVPGERGPRALASSDPRDRSICELPCSEAEGGNGFQSVGEIFDDATNPGRKKPFPMRAVMEALVDRDGGRLERWRSMAGAETAIVWDAHVGGIPVCLIGIESRNLERAGYRPFDGPESWTGGTLFPLSSKKTARAIQAASGNRPVLVLANLSGFDGSPESMRKLQLEYGAEIARAVVNFEGPLLFIVVSRYHGGAYVVFSQELNPGLRAFALAGSYASVIGGGPAASVIFTREVRARAAADPRVAELERRLRAAPRPELREELDRVLSDVILEKQAEIAAEFDAVHTVERAQRVGSLSGILEPADLRRFAIEQLEAALASAEGARSET